MAEQGSTADPVYTAFAGHVSMVVVAVLTGAHEPVVHVTAKFRVTVIWVAALLGPRPVTVSEADPLPAVEDRKVTDRVTSSVLRALFAAPVQLLGRLTSPAAPEGTDTVNAEVDGGAVTATAAELPNVEPLELPPRQERPLRVTSVLHGTEPKPRLALLPWKVIDSLSSTLSSARAALPPMATTTTATAATAKARTLDIGLIGPPLTAKKWSRKGKGRALTCTDVCENNLSRLCVLSVHAHPGY